MLSITLVIVRLTNVLMQPGGILTAETRATTAWALDQIYRIMHPISPFVTEELHDNLWGGNRDQMLITESWPEYDPAIVDAKAAADMKWVVDTITQIRSARSEMNVPPGAILDAVMVGASETAKARAETHIGLITRLARISGIEHAAEAPEGAIQVILDEATIALPLAGAIDVAEEKARLEKAIAKVDQEIMKIDKKLSNEGFLAKAPEAVVQENRDRLAEERASREKLTDALARLAAVG